MAEQDKTNFLTKTISPQMVALSPLEKWFYGLLNSGIVGGATSLTSWLGMAAAKGAGLDVPSLNLKAIGVIFSSGALSRLAMYLSQGLPGFQQGKGQP